MRAALRNRLLGRNQVFTYSVKLEKWSPVHVAELPRTGKKCTEIKKTLEGRAKLLLTFEMGLFSAETTLHILFCSVSDPKGYAVKENRCLDLKCPKNSFIHFNVTLEFCAAQCKRKSK